MEQIHITLPDGSVKEVPKGTTPADIARSISPRLADAALVARVAAPASDKEALEKNGQGELIDLRRPLDHDVKLQILTEKDPDALFVFREISKCHLDSYRRPAGRTAQEVRLRPVPSRRAAPRLTDAVIALKTALPEVLVIEPEIYADGRGYFVETYRAERYAAAGIPGPFVQDNISFSKAGVLRGLHFQNPHGQGKLVFAVEGEVFDVAVDVRVGSPNFGRWTGTALSGKTGRQLYIPQGFAHGFCVLSGEAHVAYKCTAAYDPACEMSVLWNDPDIGIAWPIKSPVVSPKDASAPRLRDIEKARLPRFGTGG